ncbi:Multiple epidermal growth factor-like domains protein 6 [Armadillidium vulgare]|nr:Multiple epidermal growth factor-like domains protein 6 [Armadillidium vulgare]
MKNVVTLTTVDVSRVAQRYNPEFTVTASPRDQRTCADINECSLGPQKVCQDTCVNTLGGSYFCTCSSGVLLDDGKSCSQASSLSCSENNGGCEQDCITKGNGDITCKCGKGFVLADDKKTCYDIDECSRGQKCRPESTCVNTVGGYKCSLDGISTCREKNGGCDHSCRETKRGIICRCNKGFI